MDGLTRGQLAQLAHINLETVRFYEQEGLLAPPSRTASGYRKFAESAVDRLEFVKRAKALGFSLGEIRDLLVIQDEHADTCVEVRDLLRTKLAIVREKMTELQKLEGQTTVTTFCCVGPAVLAVLGTSGLLVAARLEPYRVYFVLASVALLGIGFWLAYRPKGGCIGKTCTTTSSKITRALLWIAALVRGAAILLPNFVGG